MHVTSVYGRSISLGLNSDRDYGMAASLLINETQNENCENGLYTFVHLKYLSKNFLLPAFKPVNASTTVGTRYHNPLP